MATQSKATDTREPQSDRPPPEQAPPRAGRAGL